MSLHIGNENLNEGTATKKHLFKKNDYTLKVYFIFDWTPQVSVKEFIICSIINTTSIEVLMSLV